MNTIIVVTRVSFRILSGNKNYKLVPLAMPDWKIYYTIYHSLSVCRVTELEQCVAKVCPVQVKTPMIQCSPCYSAVSALLTNPLPDCSNYSPLLPHH